MKPIPGYPRHFVEAGKIVDENGEPMAVHTRDNGAEFVYIYKLKYGVWNVVARDVRSLLKLSFFGERKKAWKARRREFAKLAERVDVLERMMHIRCRALVRTGG